MADQSIDALKKHIGVEGEPATYIVEKGAIKKFADAVDDPCPLYRDPEYAKKSRFRGIIAPPGFFGWPEKGEGHGARPPVEVPRKRVLNAGSEFEYFQPVRAGEALTVRAKLADVFQRQGRLGMMTFGVTEVTYRNQRDELVAKARLTLISY